ncbi:hypothetical protein DFJ73DRAFT_956866 [Zopfochytrium polystomum]|nr:hypothetical protein DFJ73DRAFT_956866 [Zopfochytrium polystomum]
MSLFPLPVVDVSRFLIPSGEDDEYAASAVADLASDPQAVASARAMLDACETVGAFHVVGHGVESHLLTGKAFAAAEEFFALDDETKRAMPVKSGGFTRGFIGVGKESGGTATEVKEAFSYGFAWPEDVVPSNPMQGPNIYPQSLPATWRSTIDLFYSSMVSAALATTRCLALALNRPDLVSLCRGGDTISLMRVFKYLPRDEAVDDLDGGEAITTGSSPHTDWGFLTLIAANQPGLQIQLPSGGGTKWVTVKPEPNALTVNAGDYLALLSGGKVISPVHRVTRPFWTEQPRTSFVFFWYPNYDAEALPSQAASGDGEDDIKAVVSRGVSLFKDQTETGAVKGHSLDPEVLKGVPFGKYIMDKWASVARASY